jgi:putative oxidoreductase
MESLDPTLKAAGRVLLSLMFIFGGYEKIVGYAATQDYMENAGVPGVLLPLVILTELGGGLALLAGWQTRWVALALAGFCVLSGLIFHTDFSQQMQVIQFMKNLAIAGGFLVLAAAGPGAWSLDNRK